MNKHLFDQQGEQGFMNVNAIFFCNTENILIIHKSVSIANNKETADISGDKKGLSADDYLEISINQILRNFRKYNLLHEEVMRLEGWIKKKETLSETYSFSLVRLEEDKFENVTEILEDYYPVLIIGGYVIVQDWVTEKFQNVIVEFRDKYNIKDAIQRLEDTAVYWRKSGT